METLGLIISCILSLFLVLYLINIKKRNQLQNIFIINGLFTLCWCLLLLAQKYFCASLDINPIVFEWFIYIFSCFLPVCILFTGIIFANTKIKFKKKYILLFIVPILSLIMLWTNDIHHLFYINYSTNMEETIFGSYFYNVHTIYTYLLYCIGLIYLIKYSIKNSGIFSRQAILIVIGSLLPIIINVLGSLQIVPMSIYLTPICFTFTILLYAVAILKFKFLSVTPIALQRIVDRMSDSYIVLDEKNVIIDFNKSFLTTFNAKEQNIRNTDIFKFINTVHLPQLETALETVSISSKPISFEAHLDNIDKYFNIELASIINKNMFLGTLILFKDITEHMHDLVTIKSNQDMLIEKERFASLGQMIGGIAHNLKTPIMSISGATEALTDLVNEYDISIGDPEVNFDDHHEIAKDMTSWISKIKTHTSYMSDIITAVKGQAVESTDNTFTEFTIDELIKRTTILMKHELKHALIELDVITNGLNNFVLHGDINCLVQVMNNLISNAIQSYNGEPDKKIDFIVEKQDNSLILSIKDYGSGMSEEVQNKLFKEMITTKGKNGTGLGLFMSYSNIKAHFNGNINFQSEPQKGTIFSVFLPCS